MADDPAFVDDVPAVADPERLPDVVIGHEHPDPSLAELANEPVDLGHGDRIDAGEGFVEKHEAGPCGECAGDLHPAPLTPGEVLPARVAQVIEAECLHELHRPLLAHGGIELATQLEDREQVPLHRELSEHGRLLGKVPEAEPCADVHRAVGEVDLVEVNGSVVGGDEADEHVKARGLPRSVGAEEADHLAASHREAHVLDDRAGAVALREPVGGERAHSFLPCRVIVTRGPSDSASSPTPWMLPVTES